MFRPLQPISVIIQPVLLQRIWTAWPVKFRVPLITFGLEINVPQEQVSYDTYFSMFSKHCSIRTKWSRGVIELPRISLRNRSSYNIALCLLSNRWQHICRFPRYFFGIVRKVLRAIWGIKTFLKVVLRWKLTTLTPKWGWFFPHNP